MQQRLYPSSTVEICFHDARPGVRGGLVQVPEGHQFVDRMTFEDNLPMGTYRREDEAEIHRRSARAESLFRALKCKCSVGILDLERRE